MTRTELRNLQPGDIVRHAGDDKAYVVTANYGNRLTAVRTVDVTNPNEWIQVAKSTHDYAALHTPRPVSEWHEDYGPVLWWHFPIQEPPYVGSGPGMGERNADGTPTDCARLLEEGWLTHWTPLPNCGELMERWKNHGREDSNELEQATPA